MLHSATDTRALERLHYQMQLSGYFTELVDSRGVRFAYTEFFNDVWYNQAYDIQGEANSFNDIILETENFFGNRGRAPCFYTSDASPPTFSEHLERSGYEKFEDESWMLINVSDVKSNEREHTISTVVDEYTEFANVYRQGLPGPEVEQYIEAAIKGHRYAPGNVSVEYLIAKTGGTTSGMLGLVIIPPIAGIYAVATVPEMRNKGVARALNCRAAEIAKSLSCSHMMLQTVAGQESENVFKKMGYWRAFLRQGYAPREIVKDMKHG
ncbi:GNAT family N-acetyltransferase [Dinoroseobacter sp. S76]|uniref:GNAT family N-acetyltransferase n=1 Tax=Dinoroseobacter sp. S76 TaxID=3415124 RepID=UPI003C7C5382